MVWGSDLEQQRHAAKKVPLSSKLKWFQIYSDGKDHLNSSDTHWYALLGTRPGSEILGEKGNRQHLYLPLQKSWQWMKAWFSPKKHFPTGKFSWKCSFTALCQCSRDNVYPHWQFLRHNVTQAEEFNPRFRRAWALLCSCWNSTQPWGYSQPRPTLPKSETSYYISPWKQKKRLLNLLSFFLVYVYRVRHKIIF